MSRAASPSSGSSDAIPVDAGEFRAALDGPAAHAAEQRDLEPAENHASWAWFWMEFPALIVMPIIGLLGPNELNSYSMILIFIWFAHYFNRVIIFPLRIKTKNKKMPISIAISALWTGFNLIPRALNHHEWYKENFKNYPKNRKAVIPFII